MNAHLPVEAEDVFAAWWRGYLRGGSRVLDDPHARALRVVDLFGSAGGFGLGATIAARCFDRRAIFGAVVDTDADALGVYARSLPVRSAWDMSVSMLVDHSIDFAEDPISFDFPPEILDPAFTAELARTDLLIAGPPCQGHSNLNNHSRRDDPRNELFVSTVAIAIAGNVPAVVIENVPSVVNASESIVETARALFETAGYEVGMGVLRMDVLGGWQTRRRFFLVAIRGGSEMAVQGALDSWRSASGHVPSMGRPPLSSLWAIEDLQDLEGDAPFDAPPVQKEENVRRIAALFENDTHDTPNHLRPDCHKDGTTYGAVYGRMHEDLPAPTITTGIGTPGQGRFVHPTRPRMITPHEAARLQGFPDDHDFLGGVRTTRKSLAKWIGDAVPPMLGAIACGIALEQSLGTSFRPPWLPDDG